MKEAYLAIFRTLSFNSMTALRRFAAGDLVFDDAVCDVTVIGDEMPNMPFPIGTRVSLRLVHCFELADGLITKEIAYEMWREKGGPLDLDAIPEGSVVDVFPVGEEVR